MADLLIRGIPDDVNAVLVEDAERNRRSREKHALFLIETGLTRPADTCGELLDALDAQPPPAVEVEDIETYLRTRKRRSNRP